MKITLINLELARVLHYLYASERAPKTKEGQPSRNDLISRTER